MNQIRLVITAQLINITTRCRVLNWKFFSESPGFDEESAKVRTQRIQKMHGTNATEECIKFIRPLAHKQPSIRRTDVSRELGCNSSCSTLQDLNSADGNCSEQSMICWWCPLWFWETCWLEFPKFALKTTVRRVRDDLKRSKNLVGFLRRILTVVVILKEQRSEFTDTVWRR